jgi:L-ascorbate metabolism protein UlaG (beta-lactamase superfamily)
MRLTYVYHSGFAIEAPNYTAIIDYFEDSLGKKKGVVHDRLLYRPQKLYVLCSHGHPDHFNPEVLEWLEIRNDITFLFSKDIYSVSPKFKDITLMDRGDVYKDELIQVNAYGSTDLGVSFKITADNRVMFHAGDLNNWHWSEESTNEEIAEAETAFDKELGFIAESTPSLDVAMFPVDPRLGSEYMLGAEQFIAKIPTRLFVPMHFQNEYDKASAIEGYARKYGTKVYVPPRRGEILDNLEDVIDGK